MKRCPHCREEKPATLEFFYRRQFGLTAWCRACELGRKDQQRSLRTRQRLSHVWARGYFGHMLHDRGCSWGECSCGERFEGPSPESVAAAFDAHRRALGLPYAGRDMARKEPKVFDLEPRTWVA